MGRPNICCGGCTPPIITCYIEDELFHYEIFNATSAYLDYFGNTSGIITLDENGYARGSISTEIPPRSTFRVFAGNTCGTAVCEKTCYYALCYIIYKLGDVDHICAGSNRLDTVTIEFFINEMLLTGSDYPIDLNLAKFYLNGQQVSPVMQTKLVPCAVQDPSSTHNMDAVFTGLFGRTTINRCDLQDVYVLTIDVDGECGPPENYFYGYCQVPWYPRFIDKKNTAIVEINLSDGFNYSYYNRNYTECPNPSISTKCVQYTTTRNVTGLSSFNGTYMLPIKCSTQDRLRRCIAELPPYYLDDGQDNADTKKLALTGTVVNAGLIIDDNTSETLYPNGYPSFAMVPIIYQREFSRRRFEGNGRVNISPALDSGGTSVFLNKMPTKTIIETYSETRYANGDIYITQYSQTYTWNPQPWNTLCPGNPFSFIAGTLVSINSVIKNGTVIFNNTNTSNVCSNNINSVYYSSLPAPPYMCRQNPDLTYTYIPPFSPNTLSSAVGVLNPVNNFEESNPDALIIQNYCYMPYIQSVEILSNGGQNLIPATQAPIQKFGEIRGWYECL